MNWFRRLLGAEKRQTSTNDILSSVSDSPESLLEFSSLESVKAVRSDGVKDGQIFLIKLCSKLKATYQIRMLLFQAISEDKILILCVKPDCLFSNNLRRLQLAYKSNFSIQYIK